MASSDNNENPLRIDYDLMDWFKAHLKAVNKAKSDEKASEIWDGWIEFCKRQYQIPTQPIFKEKILKYYKNLKETKQFNKADLLREMIKELDLALYLQMCRL